MKRIFLSLFAALAAVVFATSCSSDNDDATTDTTQESTISYARAREVGYEYFASRHSGDVGAWLRGINIIE